MADSDVSTVRRIYKRTPWQQRYWAKVRRGGEAECWPWTASTEKDGYGQFGNEDDKSRSRKAHRLAFLLHCGRDIQSDVLRHTCDNPACCNPAHLVEGSHHDNVRDMWVRGRAARFEGWKGQAHPQSRLKNIDVRGIIALHSIGLRSSVISKMFGLASVDHVLYGSSWRHITRPA